MTTVAITGAAAVTSLGATPSMWRRFDAGEHAAGAVVGPSVDALPAAVATRAARVERLGQLVLAAGGGALHAAGLATIDGPPRAAFGVVVGTAFGCFLTNAAYERRFVDGGPAAASPRLFAATVSNAAAGELAIAYRLGGPSVTVTAGAASGLLALGHAADLVCAGRADAVVAGGADALGDELVRWASVAGLAPPAAASEAAAFLVLEDPASAGRRGVSVLGTIEGFAAAFGPDASSVDAAVTRALDDAGIAASAIAVIAGASSGASSRAQQVETSTRFGQTFGAGGALALLAALRAAAPGAFVLAVDACPTGHRAALVARAGEP